MSVCFNFTLKSFFFLSIRENHMKNFELAVSARTNEIVAIVKKGSVDTSGPCTVKLPSPMLAYETYIGALQIVNSSPVELTTTLEINNWLMKVKNNLEASLKSGTYDESEVLLLTSLDTYFN